MRKIELCESLSRELSHITNISILSDKPVIENKKITGLCPKHVFGIAFCSYFMLLSTFLRC